MKKIIYALLCLNFACQIHNSNSMVKTIVEGSGKLERVCRKIAPFDTIDLQGVGTLMLNSDQQKEPYALEVEGEDNIIPYIMSFVNHNTLIIKPMPTVHLIATNPLTYYVTAKWLSMIKQNGSTKIKAEALLGNLLSKRLSIELSNSSEIEIQKLCADELKVCASDSSKATLCGTVSHQEVHISELAKYNAQNLTSATAFIQASEFSEAEVKVTAGLKARASGKSNIAYVGNPHQKDTSRSGFASVVQR